MHSAIQRLSEGTDKHHTAAAGLPHSPATAIKQPPAESAETMSRKVSPHTPHAALADEHRDSVSASRLPHSPLTATAAVGAVASSLPLLIASPSTNSLRHVRQKSMMLLQRLATKGMAADDTTGGNHSGEAAAPAELHVAAAVPLPPSPSLSSHGEGGSISLSRGETNALTPLLRTMKQDTHLTQRLWTMLRRTNDTTHNQH